MKKYGLLCVLLWLTANVSAQNWYQNGTTVEADGIIFNVEVNKYSVFLYNVADTHLDGVLYYKDGREVESLSVYKSASAKLISKDSLLYALKDTFTEDELDTFQSLRKHLLSIFIVVDMDGRALEVSFNVDNIPEMLAIPPARFAALERNLKKSLQWQLNEVAQQLQYLDVGYFINFSQIDFDALPSPPKVHTDIDWDLYRNTP